MGFWSKLKKKAAEAKRAAERRKRAAEARARKALEAANRAVFGRHITQMVPFLRSLSTSQKRLSSAANKAKLAQLIEDVVPKKGQTRGRISGRAASIRVASTLRELGFDIDAMLRKARRYGFRTVGTVGLAAAGSAGNGGQLGVGIAFDGRWGWYSFGGATFSPGSDAQISAIVQLGLFKGSIRGLNGAYYGVELGGYAKFGGEGGAYFSVKPDWRRNPLNLFSGVTVGGGVGLGGGANGAMGVTAAGYFGD